MKTIMVLANLLLISNLTFAEVLEIDVTAGKKVIEISSSITHSGCSNNTTFLDVIETADGYTAGFDISIKKDGLVWENKMPSINPNIDQVTCMAIVKTTRKVKFKHYAAVDETIKVQIPDGMQYGLSVEVSNVEVVY